MLLPLTSLGYCICELHYYVYWRTETVAWKAFSCSLSWYWKNAVASQGSNTRWENELVIHISESPLCRFPMLNERYCIESLNKVLYKSTLYCLWRDCVAASIHASSRTVTIHLGHWSSVPPQLSVTHCTNILILSWGWTLISLVILFFSFNSTMRLTS